MKKKLVFIGVSHRTIRLRQTMLYEMDQDITRNWVIAGMWDVDPKRFEAFAQAYPGETGIKQYQGQENLRRMLDEVQPDLAFVATRDCYHAAGIIACLDAGVNVLVEKPMVISTEQAKAVLAAEARSKATMNVAFNYRYANCETKIKQELDRGIIGQVTNVDMNLMLDENHGSSFFQRWNRYRRNSGGLTIHKNGHYFDMLAWWLNQRPVEVFSYGALNYYGPDAELNPSRKDGRRCSTCDESDACEYFKVRAKKDSSDAPSATLQSQHLLRKRHNQGNFYTDYAPDACIFDSDIDIEDTYSAVIKYDGGTTVSLSINFSCPFERHRIVLNGTRGRLETSYQLAPNASYKQNVTVHYPLFSDQPHYFDVPKRSGGHGGGDPGLLEDILGGAENHLCRASAQDGAYTVAVGEAIWKSVQSGQPVQIVDLLGK